MPFGSAEFPAKIPKLAADGLGNIFLSWRAPGIYLLRLGMDDVWEELDGSATGGGLFEGHEVSATFVAPAADGEAVVVAVERRWRMLPMPAFSQAFSLMRT